MSDPSSQWGKAFAAATVDGMLAYDRHVAGPLFTPCTADFIERVAPVTGEAAIDIATGTGIVARALAGRVGSTGRVVGCDISPAMLEVARSKDGAAGRAPITWVETPAAPLAAGDGEFDVATCQQGFQFFPDRPAALTELRRVLRDGGRVALAVFDPIESCPVYAALYGAVRDVLGDDVADRYPGPWSCDGAILAREARDAGFDSVTHEHVRIPVEYERAEDVVLTLSASGIAKDYVAAGPQAHRDLVEAYRGRATQMLDGDAIRGHVTTSVILGS